MPVTTDHHDDDWIGLSRTQSKLEATSPFPPRCTLGLTLHCQHSLLTAHCALLTAHCSLAHGVAPDEVPGVPALRPQLREPDQHQLHLHHVQVQPELTCSPPGQA
eukprot:2703805-Rhodomonas_salina.2